MRNYLAVCFVVAFTGGVVRGQTTAPATQPTLADLVDPSAKWEKLGTGLSWAEGPVWLGGDNGYLVLSDAHGQDMWKWSQAGGFVKFRTPSNASNGNTRDAEGRLVSTEQSTRRITRTEKDGTITVLADNYMGKHFTSPNDIVVRSDGSVYFSDPPLYTPNAKEKVLDGDYIFRIDGKTHEVTIAVKGIRPNGLAFSPDEKKLYVTDGGPIAVCDVNADGTCGPAKPFIKLKSGYADGFRVDADGRIWTSSSDGVEIFSPDGTWIGTIDTQKSIGTGTTNLCFGGKDNKTVFIACNPRNTTNQGSLYSIRVKVPGALLPAGAPRE
jgi:gluconolactonase